MYSPLVYMFAMVGFSLFSLFAESQETRVMLVIVIMGLLVAMEVAFLRDKIK